MAMYKHKGPYNECFGPPPPDEEKPKQFAIAYKATERMPGGRAVGYPGLYKTREEAQQVLDAKLAAGWKWAEDMHVIETTGEIEAVKPD
jgi:hypothetical protein